MTKTFYMLYFNKNQKRIANTVAWAPYLFIRGHILYAHTTQRSRKNL